MVADEKSTTNEKSTSVAAKKVILHSNADNEDVEIHPSVLLASGLLVDFVKSVPKESCDVITLPCKGRAYALRKVATFVETLNSFSPKKFEEYTEKRDEWVEYIPTVIDKLRPIAEDMDGNRLIECANEAERVQHMNVREMRAYLNETADFDQEQLDIINQCPELGRL